MIWRETDAYNICFLDSLLDRCRSAPVPCLSAHTSAHLLRAWALDVGVFVDPLPTVHQSGILKLQILRNKGRNVQLANLVAENHFDARIKRRTVSILGS